jgi:hypothetical protein
MSEVRQKGEKGRYDVLHSKCLGCKCFNPGGYQVRGATLAGSRNTGKVDLCCMRRAYHGCPDEAEREFTEERLKERKKEVIARRKAFMRARAREALDCLIVDCWIA